MPLLFPTMPSPCRIYQSSQEPLTFSRGRIFRAIDPFRELSFLGRLSSINRTP